MPAQPPRDGFGIVKEILQLIARFQTPATPEVYEVWYQYVLKENEPLVEALDYAIDENRVIDGPMLVGLREQFCPATDDAVVQIQSSMATQLSSLRSIVLDQKNAGDEFAGSLNEASKEINRDGQTIEQLANCVAELTTATEMMGSHMETMSTRLDDADAKVSELKRALAESQRGMMTDPLTGIGNRRYFDAMVRQLIDLDQKRQKVNCLALIDLDKFKAINDTFGHDVGDRVISHIANKISTRLPQADLARLGGDEFAIFVTADTYDQAVDLIEGVRVSMSSKPIEIGETGQSLGEVSFSAGLAALREQDDESMWYQRADRLLYEAKGLGGNRLVAEKGIR